MSPSCVDSGSTYRTGAEDGFTLLELLVSLAILVLFLAVGLTALSVAMRGDRQAAFLTEATLIARSKIAAAGVDFPLRAGAAARGLEDGFPWSAEVEPYGSARLESGGLVRAFRVRVTVSDPRSASRALSLFTIALARGSAGP
jgi:prepilin-type N-terminal cleavage/methylation domain-containing protein